MTEVESQSISADGNLNCGDNDSEDGSGATKSGNDGCTNGNANTNGNGDGGIYAKKGVIICYRVLETDRIVEEFFLIPCNRPDKILPITRDFFNDSGIGCRDRIIEYNQYFETKFVRKEYGELFERLCTDDTVALRVNILTPEEGSI